MILLYKATQKLVLFAKFEMFYQRNKILDI